MRIVKTQDAELRCEHLPRPGAPALLLINSLGTSLEMWDSQAEAFAEHFELIRYDARGHGKSSLGAATELTVDQLARDALAVLDTCGIARAHICGLSLGGMTAMQIARHWPDRVLKLALCNTAAHLPPRERWTSIIETALTQGMAALADGVLGRWFTPGFHAAQPEQVERIRQMLLDTDPRGYAACCAAIRDLDLREDIKSIDASVLVIGGTQDPSTPAEHAELIARSIQGAQRVMLESAHLSNIERASEFTSALLEFLAAEAVPG
jgi:3-oxoadipate enol-lactonase